MSCVLTVQGNLILHDETKTFIFVIKWKVLSCIVYSCFFVLSTLSFWNRVNGVHWWRGEQGALVQGWREYHGPNNSDRNLRNDQTYSHYWYNSRFPNFGICWGMRNQLDVTCYFISIIMRSTCFGH